MIAWLMHLESKDELHPEDNAKCYSLDEIKKTFEVEELTKNCWLVLSWGSEKLWLDFAVMEFYYGSADSDEIFVKCIFHGQGASDNLRECRHTYWGDAGDGYLFYPNGIHIAAAFKALSKYFDDMA